MDAKNRLINTDTASAERAGKRGWRPNMLRRVSGATIAHLQWMG